ncbi:MAG: alpha-L-fucosidase [Planctomycetota bacterium]|jgi:alpha-L-fucosidase
MSSYLKTVRFCSVLLICLLTASAFGKFDPAALGDEKMLTKKEYETQIASTRDARMKWWRQARFGMFVHYGLYSQVGRNEWVMAKENIPVKEYEKYAKLFNTKPGAAREWAALAKKAGMKYMVLTTRHHDGFSLWNSKVNPYNSVNFGPKRDLVKEFVDACREFDLKIGFYSSLMDWHHPDGYRCAHDSEARKRFTKYIDDLNTELLSNYGKIDILWYDLPRPMESWEGWNSLERNQKMRQLQPDIIINDRGRLDEDFGTPEEHLKSSDRDWEACMTFNGISWGYVDSAQARPYSYNAQQILKMLSISASGGGNLLLNIGPAPDGSIPEEAVEPLTTVGRWLKENGDAVYGRMYKKGKWPFYNYGGNGVSYATSNGKSVYIWVTIWPDGGLMGIGGYFGSPKAIRLLKDGMPIDFEYKTKEQRILLKNLPAKSPDIHAGVTVIEMEFDEIPKYERTSLYPQTNIVSIR